MWQDFKIESTEDQQKMLLPLTRTTEKLFYNQRVIIDNKVLTEPRAWMVSKVNRLNQNGVLLLTFAQDNFDQNKDYIELDSDGNVIGMWADYFIQPINPDPVPTAVYIDITYSAKAQLKVGGSYKKFTVIFRDADGNELPFENGTWSYTIDGGDASSLVTTTTGEAANQNKIKFVGDSTYIGSQMVIGYTSDSGITGEVTVDIVGL